ncbi:hypothetical protein BDZ45DRAFT_804178 [Acephala macrosclerotiorum]|nr:hypothetical protein BDZ45DRAFT_804178 [Acephala macrosclerotiorum]
MSQTHFGTCPFGPFSPQTAVDLSRDLSCHESRRQVWKHFDESRHLGNELCADMVYFSFSRDLAYLTQNTLHDLMQFWKRCSDQHPEFPLNDGAGKVLRTQLRYLVFDASILSGDDVCTTPQQTVVFGNEEVMEALGPGLASFSSLEEVTLVQVPVANASVDEGLSAINLFKPQKNTYPDFLLEMAAEFLRYNLDHYFNKFEYKRRKPPSIVPRKPRKIPAVKTMFKSLH